MLICGVFLCRPASCVCIAIGCFAENSLATNLVACDAMVKLYNRLSETCDPVHSQRVLQAIGKVASSNKDNQARLLTNGAVELVKGALKDISAEGSDLDRCPHGALRAVAGMANGFAATQQKFCDSKDVCRNVVRFLVTKMDDVLVAQWGCAAIAALGNNHVGNSDQVKFTSLYIHDTYILSIMIFSYIMHVYSVLIFLYDVY